MHLKVLHFHIFFVLTKYKEATKKMKEQNFLILIFMQSFLHFSLSLDTCFCMQFFFHFTYEEETLHTQKKRKENEVIVVEFMFLFKAKKKLDLCVKVRFKYQKDLNHFTDIKLGRLDYTLLMQFVVLFYKKFKFK